MIACPKCGCEVFDDGEHMLPHPCGPEPMIGRVLTREERMVLSPSSTPGPTSQAFADLLATCDALEAKRDDMQAHVQRNAQIATDQYDRARFVLDNATRALCELETYHVAGRALVVALEATATKRQFGNCWCQTADGCYCVGQPQCRSVHEALAAAPACWREDKHGSS